MSATLLNNKKEKKLTPKLRFRGFDDYWEIKNLGELLEF